MDNIPFGLRVGLEGIYGNNHRNTELARDLNVRFQIADTLAHQFQILLDVSLNQRASGDDPRPATVHLQCAHRRHQYHGIRDEARGATLDVEELLHPDIGAKARLGE